MCTCVQSSLPEQTCMLRNQDSSLHTYMSDKFICSTCIQGTSRGSSAKFATRKCVWQSLRATNNASGCSKAYASIPRVGSAKRSNDQPGFEMITFLRKHTARVFFAGFVHSSNMFVNVYGFREIWCKNSATLFTEPFRGSILPPGLSNV